jgi:hypothetical protein
LEHLRKLLPARLAAQIVYEAPQPWQVKPLAIKDRIREAAAEVAKTQEERLIEQFEQRRGKGRGVRFGLEKAVAALQDGQIGPRGHGWLILGPDPREAVARCTVCRSLFLDMPRACPRCHAACVDASLWEEVLLLALRRDIAVHCVKDNRLLARHGGIAAILPATSPDGRLRERAPRKSAAGDFKTELEPT